MRLPFDHSNGTKLKRLLADASFVACVDHLNNVLVRLGRLLGHELGRGNADRDALFGELVQDDLIVELSARLVAGLCTSSAMASGAYSMLSGNKTRKSKLRTKRLLHAQLGAC